MFPVYNHLPYGAIINLAKLKAKAPIHPNYLASKWLLPRKHVAVIDSFINLRKTMAM